MNRHHLTAAKTALRVWAPKAVQLDLIERADAGFDGGEWSGPWHAERQREAYERTLAEVAPRFGLTAPQLEYAIEVYEHEQEEMEMFIRHRSFYR
jgi:hypothetical protein